MMQGHDGVFISETFKKGFIISKMWGFACHKKGHGRVHGGATP